MTAIMVIFKSVTIVKWNQKKSHHVEYRDLLYLMLEVANSSESDLNKIFSEFVEINYSSELSYENMS